MPAFWLLMNRRVRKDRGKAIERARGKSGWNLTYGCQKALPTHVVGPSVGWVTSKTHLKVTLLLTHLLAEVLGGDGEHLQAERGLPQLGLEVLDLLGLVLAQAPEPLTLPDTLVPRAAHSRLPSGCSREGVRRIVGKYPSSAWMWMDHWLRPLVSRPFEGDGRVRPFWFSFLPNECLAEVYANSFICKLLFFIQYIFHHDLAQTT